MSDNDVIEDPPKDEALIQALEEIIAKLTEQRDFDQGHIERLRESLAQSNAERDRALEGQRIISNETMTERDAAKEEEWRRGVDFGLKEAVGIIGTSISLNGGNPRVIAKAIIRLIKDPTKKTEAEKELE